MVVAPPSLRKCIAVLLRHAVEFQRSFAFERSPFRFHVRRALGCDWLDDAAHSSRDALRLLGNQRAPRFVLLDAPTCCCNFAPPPVLRNRRRNHRHTTASLRQCALSLRTADPARRCAQPEARTRRSKSSLLTGTSRSRGVREVAHLVPGSSPKAGLLRDRLRRLDVQLTGNKRSSVRWSRKPP